MDTGGGAVGAAALDVVVVVVAVVTGGTGGTGGPIGRAAASVAPPIARLSGSAAATMTPALSARRQRGREGLGRGRCSMFCLHHLGERIRPRDGRRGKAIESG